MKHIHTLMHSHILTTLYTLLALFLCSLPLQAENKETEGDKLHIHHIYHVVKKGESVYSIAKLYHADMEEIFKLNPGSKKSIWEGATLLIPSMVMDEVEADESDTLHIREKLQEFVGQVYTIGSLETSTLSDIKSASKRVKAVEAKYNVFYQSKQADIADNDGLMELVSEFQQLKQETLDTLEVQRTCILQRQAFAAAEKFIASQLTVYKDYEARATQLSLVQATAPQLEALQTQEQVLFADIEQKYQTAKAAAEQDATLSARMKKITANYTTLKSSSEKIQAAAYKSVFDRIKDYLLSLAAVAIILMFINMLQAKIKSLKQARDAAKKLQEMQQKDNSEYPSI